MKKANLLILIALAISTSIIALPVNAGVGGIRIEPPLPIMTESPAEFKIYVQNGDTANDPHIFLVMTESCHAGLTGDVEVSWEGGSITITNWYPEPEDKKIPPNAKNGANYTIASLKSHLETSGPIYWAFEPILSGALTTVPVNITVTLPSTDPEMLVYIMGKSNGSELFDMRVPPTIPGFVVPEIPLGTIAGLASMITALLLITKRPILKK